MQRAFQTTRWTLILQVANSANQEQRQEALAELVSLNWFPLYTFLRRSGKQADEAEDLIQGFFARLIEKKTLEHLEGPERGRFRNFLLVCLKRSETAFDRSWALDVIDRGLESVSEAWTAAGKSDRFEMLKVYLSASHESPSYRDVSEKMGVSEGALRVMVHRLRADFRQAICDIVADTLESGDLLEDEINHLFSALNS